MEKYLHNFAFKNMEIASNFNEFFAIPIFALKNHSGLFFLYKKFKKIVILKQILQSFECNLTNPTFYVFYSKNYAFSMLKKYVNLLKNLPQICFNQKIEIFALKFLFFEIFRRRKISQNDFLK